MTVIVIGLILLAIVTHRRTREFFTSLAIGVPVYLVSLDKDVDRRNHIFGIVTPNVVHAINGKVLNRDALVRDGLVKNEKMTLGEYGCYMSHYNILEKIDKDTGHDVSLVLEDDADLDIETVTSMVNHIIENFKEDWDIILLGYNMYIADGEPKNGLVRINYFHGAQGYLVNNKNAYKYTNLMPIEAPYDVVLAKTFNTFILDKKVIHLSKEFGGSSNTQGIN